MERTQSQKLTIIISLILILTACTNGTNKNKDSKQERNVTNLEFPYVSVPSFITDRGEAAKYLVRNFWNNYFKTAEKDTAIYSINNELFEKAYVNYVKLLNMVGATEYDAVRKAQNSLFVKADSLYMAGHKAPLMRFMEFGEKYLYDPNSPYLNEETYIPALEAILNLKSIDSLNKLSFKYQLELASLNRIGSTANDFEFVYISGINSQNGSYMLKPGNMHKIKAKYLLIYFNNPDCKSCKEQQQILLSDQLVQQLIEQGEIVILAMYIDEQTDIWERNYANIPQNWIYAHDPYLTLRDNEKYGLRAIPSMYLLDNNKKVLLKDVQAQQVLNYFHRL